MKYSDLLNYIKFAVHPDKDKIKKTVKNIFEREAKHVKGILSCEKRRFLNTVTPKGLVCYTDTINTLCNKIYLLKKQPRFVKKMLTNRGFNVIIQ